MEEVQTAALVGLDAIYLSPDRASGPSVHATDACRGMENAEPFKIRAVQHCVKTFGVLDPGPIGPVPATPSARSEVSLNPGAGAGSAVRLNFVTGSATARKS